MGELCARHTAPLRRWARRCASPSLLSRVEPDDLVQETVLEAMRRFAEFEPRGEGSFVRWLAKLAEHRIRNLGRYESAQRRTARREQPLEDVVAPVDDPAQRAALREELERCEREIAGLRRDDAVLIRARLQRDVSLERIAGAAGCSKNAVALRLSRALRRLRARCERGQ